MLRLSADRRFLVFTASEVLVFTASEVLVFTASEVLVFTASEVLVFTASEVSAGFFLAALACSADGRPDVRLLLVGMDGIRT
jgi:hypothetical protein